MADSCPLLPESCPLDSCPLDSCPMDPYLSEQYPLEPLLPESFEYRCVPISWVHKNAVRHREVDIRSPSFQQLLKSIREEGLVHSLETVCNGHHSYVILSGHRRLEACLLAGFNTISIKFLEKIHG